MQYPADGHSIDISTSLCRSKMEHYALPPLFTLLIFFIFGANISNVHASRYEATSHLLQYEAPRVTPRRTTPDDYNSLRNIFFENEESKALGADIELNNHELEANEIIMSVKNKEYQDGMVTPHSFAPSQHLFSVLDKIRASPLFKYLSYMPKGAVLHAHDTSMCSTDFLIELTYRPALWVCKTFGALDAIALKFAKEKPLELEGQTACSWELLETVRASFGAEKVDAYLRERFTLYPTEKFLDSFEVWQHFSSIFNFANGLLLFARNWEDYYYNVLKEYYADGVQYLEIRTTLPRLYDLEGYNYTEIDTVRIFKETLDKFKAANPGFIGCKLIYTMNRRVDDDGMAEYIKVAIQVKQKYPDFIAGIDIANNENVGRPLRDFIPQLLSLPDDIDFYFHAGETNWYGTSVDENLIDAVLLGTKRIGHGFVLVKHPMVLKMVKDKDIAIEVNPISNQVLQLISDFRNHPCAHYFAGNYPVVVSSDDRSFWKATPLTHDFYIAFLGIASAHSDLRLLKKLAMNSLQYSSLNVTQKESAMAKWQTQWDAFIERVITSRANGTPSRFQNNWID